MRSFSVLRAVVVLALAFVLAVWTLIPLVWMFLVSLLPTVEITAVPPVINLSHVGFDRFQTLLADPSFGGALFNSLQAAAGTTVVTVTTASLAAYALARFEMRGKSVLLGGALATQLVPAIVLVIPMYILMRRIGLVDSIAALIVIYTTFLLPYCVWLLRNFFEQIPRSIEAAARIDGCSRLGTLFRIVLPLAAPGVAATAIFVFISSWNEFLFALILTLNRAKTVTVRLTELQTTLFGQQDFTMVGAASLLAVLPVVVMVVLFNRYIVRGLTQGALKG